jgi:hypothetical protein
LAHRGTPRPRDEPKLSIHELFATTFFAKPRGISMIQENLNAVIDHLLRSKQFAVVLILIIGLIALLAHKDGLLTVYSNISHSQLQFTTSAWVIAQAADNGENEVSTDEVEKYVSVYKAMQRDRTLTVDRATAAQGLTTKQFRELENRVQRDEAAMQQVRDELQAAAQASPVGRSSIPGRP